MYSAHGKSRHTWSFITLHSSYLHSFIMPMSTQRLSRHAWQWRLLSLVIVQLPLKGHVKEALRFILRLKKRKTDSNLLKSIQKYPNLTKTYTKEAVCNTTTCVIKNAQSTALKVQIMMVKKGKVCLPLKPERNRLHKQAKYGAMPRNLGLTYAKQ